MSHSPHEFNALETALFAHCTVQDLKMLASNLRLTDPPTRKADLIKAICNHMTVKLPSIVKRLSKIEQWALSEIVRSWNGQFFEDRFEAKYAASLPDTRNNVLSIPSLAAGIRDGMSLADIVAGTSALVDIPAKSEMDKLFKEMTKRTKALRDLGTARLFACSTTWQRKIMANPDTDSLCLAAGKQHIVVLPGKEAEFTRALEAMGCILPELQS